MASSGDLLRTGAAERQIFVTFYPFFLLGELGCGFCCIGQGISIDCLYYLNREIYDHGRTRK